VRACIPYHRHPTPLDSGAAAALLGIAVVASPALAHDEPFVVARTGDSPARLAFTGPQDLLDGSESLELLPGDASFSGLWIHDNPAFASILLDQPDVGLFRLAPDHAVALRLVAADAPLRFFNPATFDPILDAPGASFAFIHDQNGDFSINLLSASTLPGNYAATFDFTDLSGASLDSAPFTLRFQTVPTPASVPLALMVGIAGARRRRR
jgi:hypothetical protein